MSFLDAISDPQNIKYSHWESRYSGSRKTHSENVGFANVLGVSKVLFQRIPLHFHWKYMLFLNAIHDPQNSKYSHWESRYSGSRNSRSENIGFVNVLGVSRVLFQRFPLYFH